MADEGHEPSRTERLAQAAVATAREKVEEQVKERLWGLFVAWAARYLPILALSVTAGAAAGVVSAKVTAGPIARRIARQQAAAAPADPAAAPATQVTLAVTSEPTAARVTLDGRLVGVTPLDRLVVDPGQHGVVVELAGYEPFVASVLAEPGKPLAVNAVLLPAQAAAKKPIRSSGGGGAPKKPWLNCSGKRQECDNRCGRLEFDCRSRCHCQDKPSDVCAAERNACYDRCKELRISCESGCDVEKSSCEEMSGPP